MTVEVIALDTATQVVQPTQGAQTVTSGAQETRAVINDETGAVTRILPPDSQVVESEGGQVVQLAPRRAHEVIGPAYGLVAGTGATRTTGKVQFTYLDGTVFVTNLASGEAVVKTCIVIETAFDGAGATLELSGETAGDIMGTGDSCPDTVEQYLCLDLYCPTGATAVNLTVVGGSGATQGSGFVYQVIAS